MKKTSKVISIIISAFMIMQLMTGMVFASSLAPSNPRWVTGQDLGWNTDDKGWIAWDLVDGYDLYVLYIYKDNVQISTCLTERDEDYDFGYESVWGDMQSGGTGNYTVKVATYGGNWDDFDKYEDDEDMPVLGVSEMSEPFSYVGDATAKQESNNTEPVITAGSSDNNASATQTESKTAVSATGEIECPCAVKVCHDLGIMPNVYEDENKFVTYEGFYEVAEALDINYKYIKEKAGTLVTLKQACARLSGNGVGFKVESGLGIHIDREANITYSQLAKIVYNYLHGTELTYEAYMVDNTGMIVPNGSVIEEIKAVILFRLGYVKYEGNVSMSGDKATVNGRLFNKENSNGIDANDVVLNIGDKDLKDGDNQLLFIKDDTIVSAVPAEDIKNEKVTKEATVPVKITLTIGSHDATVDGEAVANDAAPMIVNDRTMLPIRFVAEALGATVSWYQHSQTVTIKARNTTINIKIGEKTAEITKQLNTFNTKTETVELDSPAFIENDRTYLPLRFVAENLGAEVQWDGTTQTITITK